MLHERCLLGNDFLMELWVGRSGRYRLALRQGGKSLVEYRDGGNYEFKSVEKLRYDFARDVEKALRQA